MLSRRDFLKLSGAGIAALYATGRGRLPLRAQAAQGLPLPGSAIPQFVDRLPLLSVAGGPMQTVLPSLLDGTDDIVVNMVEAQANVMPSTFVPATPPYSGTWVFRYVAEPGTGVIGGADPGTYLGPVIVTARNNPTQIRFVNNLPGDGVTPNLAWREWTDQTLHWADPLGDGMNMDHYSGPVPACVHVHGGEIPPVLDGGPDSWFTSDGAGAYIGHGFYSKDWDGVTPQNYSIYRYPNTQEAAMIWFHDHLLGGTRLNVYAGLAGAYPIIDLGLTLPTGLHPVGLQQGAGGPVDFLVPMVLQDRMFDTNGQLFFPNVGINPEHPYWIPEFVGDTIVVNGKVWPFLEVAPKRYRFLFVNGSNARTYEMFLVNPVTKVMGPPIWQIGTDGGYLDAPVRIDPNAPKGQLQRLVLMPGERADVIIDFAGFMGQTLILRNTGRTPFPKGAPPDGATLGRIIQIRVNQPFTGPDASYNPNPATGGGQAIRSIVTINGQQVDQRIVRLVNPTTGTLAAGVSAAKTRQLTLNEVMGMGGPLEVLVNNTKWDGLSSDTVTFTDGVRPDFDQVGPEYFSEVPNEGDTEVWEIVNLTADAHPIHTHLTQFQLINRQAFNLSKYNAAYAAAFPGGLFIPAFGPPANYTTGMTFGAVPVQVTNFLGGNPDITKYLQGPVMPPLPNEAGWKDTVIMYPGQVTRIAVRFAPINLPTNTPATDLHYPFDPNVNGHSFVWHCHIVDHEDNEMMRPYAVTPKAGATRTYVQGTDY